MIDVPRVPPAECPGCAALRQHHEAFCRAVTWTVFEGAPRFINLAPSDNPDVQSCEAEAMAFVRSVVRDHGEQQAELVRMATDRDALTAKEKP